MKGKQCFRTLTVQRKEKGSASVYSGSASVKESVPSTGEAARPNEQAPGAAAVWYSFRQSANRVRQARAHAVVAAALAAPPQHAPDASSSR